MIETGYCVRGRECWDAQFTVDTAGKRVMVGGTSTQPLCNTCIRHLGYLMTSLPLDIVELSACAVPSMAVRYRAPDMPTAPRVKLHAPLPIDGTALALQDLIDHEVTSWAESTADAAGVEWSSLWARRSRQLHRVRTGCQLLRERMPWFLTLPPVTHRVRSAGERPMDGWPEDMRARMDMDPHGEWWIDRDGTEGALTLFELHLQVERFTGRAGGDLLPAECPKCKRRALVREHRTRRVTCRRCWRDMSDDAYDQLVRLTCDLFGVTA